MVKVELHPLKVGVPAPQLADADPARSALSCEIADLDSMWWADRLAGEMPEERTR